MLNWYLQTGENSDVVISSKVSLVRNLSQFNFYIKEEQEILKLEKLLEENLLQIGYELKYFKLRNLERVKIQSLLEKDLMDSKMVQNIQNTSILINDEENVCIQVNNDDHLKLQAFASGLEIEAILNLCIEIDEKLQTIVNISKSYKYGYLTTSPTNLGTGMKIAIMLHLPGLTKTKNIQKLIRYVRQFGIQISKVQNTDFYEISNERTLGITEEDIAKNIKAIAHKIIEQEREARKLLAENKIELEDVILRSYGILTNCKKISRKEAEELLSNVKLGTDLGIITNLTDAKIKKLYLYVKPANLKQYFGQELNFNEDIKRSEMIQQITKD